MNGGTGPLQASYDGISPVLGGAPAFAGRGAAVLGRARIGRGAWLGDFAVIRADGHDVFIGDDFHLGEHATVHIAHDLYPTHIGNRVSAGAGTVIHACEVGDGCVIGRGAVILDGSVIEAGAVLSDDALVFPRTRLEGGWLYAGSPAKPVARISAEELEAYHLKLRGDREQAPAPTLPAADVAAPEDIFVAANAALGGRIRAGAQVGIWYGCRLSAGGHSIEIGDRTNVQDNSVIRCEGGDVVIAPDVTVGHNVTLIDCRVESGSLVGIGSRLSRGTVVESDVLVAAGTETEADQRLTSGFVWAGKPARRLAPMDERKRKMLKETLRHYCSYAAHFRDTPRTPLTGGDQG